MQRRETDLLDDPSHRGDVALLRPSDEFGDFGRVERVRAAAASTVSRRLGDERARAAGEEDRDSVDVVGVVERELRRCNGEEEFDVVSFEAAAPLR
jgi:hypothetical protein